MQRLCRAATLAALLVATTPGQDRDWPGFRGPGHDGVSEVATPPTRWSDDQNIRWQVELPGPGSSSPVVADGKAYVASYSGYGSHLDDGGTGRASSTTQLLRQKKTASCSGPRACPAHSRRTPARSRPPNTGSRGRRRSCTAHGPRPAEPRRGRREQPGRA